MLEGKNYIGSRQSAKGSKHFQTFNPVLNLPNDTLFYEATPGEIGEAVGLAGLAREQYAATSHIERADFLEAIADEILSLGQEVIAMYCTETGLPEGRAIGERGRTVGQLRSFAALLRQGFWVDATIDTAQPLREPAPRPDIRKMLVPLGPVAVFGASNFPFAFSTAGGDTASALAAGCPVIVKSHPLHAGTGEMMASAIIKAARKRGMPDGVFSNLNSSGTEVGVALVKDPGIKAVGFTGSSVGGNALVAVAAGRKEPIPVFAEMGSVNPMVLLPKALEKKGREWARAIAGSISLGAGQFCTNPGLLIGLEGAGLKNFATLLADEILRSEPASMLHPRIRESYEKNRQFAIGQDKTKVVAEYVNAIRANFGRQTVLTVTGSTFLENDNLHKEVFGPFSLIVGCNDDEQLGEVINSLEGQLTGTVIASGDDADTYSKVTGLLKNKVGRLIYNGVPTGVEVCGAMHHGGPYPATSDSRYTSVGLDAIKRWVRPLCFQDWPDALLPDELKNANPLKIVRKVNDELTDSQL